MRVASKSRGGTRNNSRDRKDPQRSYACSSFHGSRNTQTRWKDRSNTTSFYFTRFLENVNEMDLWGILGEWGQVREIFIPTRRNKEGRRYGFERFSGVIAVNRLERQLDNLVIGGLKLHINVPKYERQTESRPQLRLGLETRRGGGTQVNIAPRQNHRVSSMSYKNALLTTPTTLGQRQGSASARLTHGESHSSIHLDIPAGAKHWFSDAWVGQLKLMKTLEEA